MPVRAAIAFGFEVMRINVVITWLTKAHTVISPGKYYPIPVVGPIMAGALAGCLGGFFHGGIRVVEKEVPWIAQSALYASAAFHLAIYDPTASTLLQSIVFPGATVGQWRALVHVSTVLFVAMTAVLQEALLGKDFNPLAPLHAVAYAVSTTPAPPPLAASSLPSLR